MTVKIITDSLSDITSDLAKELDVTVVPLTVMFGRESFLDRVTITTDEFYRRLTQDSNWPTTTQPAPSVFADLYDKMAGEADGILVLTLSAKLSGTYNSAIGAKTLMKKKIRVEVIDTRTVIMGEGLIVINAARAAKAGAKLDELVSKAQQFLPKSHSVMFFDTLKYLAKGGRIGRAQGMLGSLLSVKPILTLRDGEVSPLTRVRSRTAGMDYLYNFVAGFPKIDGLAVEHATTPEDADELINRLTPIYPKEKIFRSTVSPVIGTYTGPNVLAVSVLEGEGK